MSASFEVVLSGNPHFAQVLNCAKSVKNALLTKATKNKLNFERSVNLMKTGLKKSQKITEILFDEASQWITVNTYNTDLKRRLSSYTEKHPDLCRQTNDTEDGGLSFEIVKGRFCFRLTEPYSNKRRAFVDSYFFIILFVSRNNSGSVMSNTIRGHYSLERRQEICL